VVLVIVSCYKKERPTETGRVKYLINDTQKVCGYNYLLERTLRILKNLNKRPAIIQIFLDSAVMNWYT